MTARASEPPLTNQSGVPIRLDSNENAYGPSEKVLAAMQDALGSANRYPFAEYIALRDEIARKHSVKPEQVVIGCGSTELLRMAAGAFLGSGKSLIMASPTFDTLARYGRGTGVDVISVPLDRAYAHDLDTMLGRVNASTGLVYICNPNNPTASITPRKSLETFIGKLPANCRVLIDEAYHHYASQSERYMSFLDYPMDDERVIVVRTFSKVYGLAGMRLGYGVAPAVLAKQMDAFRTFINANTIAVKAASAALNDPGGLAHSVKRNTDDRQEFFNQAMARMLKPIDSHTNFVMMNTHHPATEVIDHFQKNNILIAHEFPAMATHIRVSMGVPAEMREFWRVWDLLPFAAQMQH